MQQLDDHLVLLQSMGFSPHKRPFEERLGKWETQLRLVRDAPPAAGLGFASGSLLLFRPRCHLHCATCGAPRAPQTKLTAVPPLPQVSDILEQWISLQRAWMYLEPVFASKDIQQQLPLEAKRFAAVDRGWRKMMDGTRRAPGVLKARPLLRRV
jgi:dynein heavy chain